MIKKLAVMLLAVVLLLTPLMALGDSCKDDYRYDNYLVTTGDVNVRFAPNINSTSIGVIHKGVRVYPLNYINTVDGRTWVQILFNGTDGYVSDMYLDVVYEEERIIDSSTVSAEVTGNAVNIRRLADINADVIGTYSKGTVLDVDLLYCSYADGRVWAEIVQDDGSMGYVSMKYLKLLGDYPILATKMKVDAESINIRKYPAINSDIVKVASNGTEFDIAYLIPTGDGRIWAACVEEGQFLGYVSVLYLRAIE